MDEADHLALVRFGPALQRGELVSTVLLIRHGMCGAVGIRIAGRTPGVHLDSRGRRQARALADVLARLPIVAVHSSPLDRARETAKPLAARLGLVVEEASGLEELDYGDWTGCTLASLAGDPAWQRFNRERAATRVPGGETMEEVVERAARAVADMRARQPDGMVAAVTHGDVIRALLTSWAGMSIDHMLRLEIAPGSVSAVRFMPEPHLLAVNWLPRLGDVL